MLKAFFEHSHYKVVAGKCQSEPCHVLMIDRGARKTWNMQESDACCQAGVLHATLPRLRCEVAFLCCRGTSRVPCSLTQHRNSPDPARYSEHGPLPSPMQVVQSLFYHLPCSPGKRVQRFRQAGFLLWSGTEIAACLYELSVASRQAFTQIACENRDSAW